MTRWCKKLVLVLALTMMPLQGIAATLSVLLCHGDAQAHAMHEPGSHGSSADGLQGQDDKGGTTANAAYHQCCNFSVTALSITTLAVVQQHFSVRALAPDSLHDLFVPDRPQRPPLA